MILVHNRLGIDVSFMDPETRYNLAYSNCMTSENPPILRHWNHAVLLD
jgi:hypothetical protein